MFNLQVGIECDGAKGAAVPQMVISGIEDFQKKITEEVKQELQELMKRTWLDIIQQFPKKTGNTSDGFKFNILGPMSFEIAVEGEQAVMVYNFIEFGTKAHGPKTAPFLAWKGDDGKWIRAKWVRGIKAHHIVRFALEKLSSEIDGMEGVT